MWGSRLALLALLALDPAEDPQALVAQLGSDRHAEAAAALAADPDPAGLVRGLGAARYGNREAAARAPKALGRDALPALRAARDSGDPEVRTRARRLAEAIERDWLVRPTLILLDFQDRPLDEVIGAIDGRKGLRLALMAAPSDPSRRRAVTVRTAGPVPFWDAVERICRAADLVPPPANHLVNPGLGGPIAYLMPSKPDLKPSPFVDSGPFRVYLVSLDLKGHSGSGAPVPAVPAAQLSARLMIEPEPRMFVIPDGRMGWTEAVDDRGQSLVPPGGETPRRYPAEGGYGFFATSSSAMGPRLTLVERLQRPHDPGRTIRRLRGTLPVLLAARGPVPIVVPMEDAEGKTVEDDEVAITVQEIRADARPPALPSASVHLLVRSRGKAALRPRMLEHQIEVSDAEGHVFRVGHMQVDSNREGARVRLGLHSAALRRGPVPGGPPADGRASGPARLTFHHMIEAPTELSFAFEDVPMP
jgi:hypothetical protein